MSWFDGIGSGIGSMVDSVRGAPAAAMKAGQAHLPGNTSAQGIGQATGLSPYMKMFGMTPPEAGEPGPAGREAGVAGRGGLWDTITGKGTTYGGKMIDNKESNGFEALKNPDGSTASGYKMPSVSSWGGSGTTYGNRQQDIDGAAGTRGDITTARGEAADKALKLAAPEIYQPDLSKLDADDRTFSGQRSIASSQEIKDADGKGTGKFENNTGAGSFTDTAWGASSGSEGAKTTIDPLTGKGNTSLGSVYGVVGGEYKTGVRAGAMSDDKRFTADAEAGFVASGGASGSAGLDTKNGAYATGGVGGKVGLYGQANAGAKSESLSVGGVDYDAGIAAHADAFVGAKAGLGGTVGIGPDFVGAKGNIGAFVGAEAAADISGNLGPLGGKVGASGMVGAGIGADGDISFKDGKFHVGGKMFAALGYGGSLSADMTVDVGAMGKSAYNLGATGLDYAGKGLNAAGQGISTGMDYAGKGLNAAGNAIGNTATDMYNGATKSIGTASKAIGNTASDLYDGATQGLNNAGNTISNGATSVYNGATQGLNNAGNAISNGATSVYNGATQGLNNAGNAISNGASRLMSW